MIIEMRNNLKSVSWIWYFIAGMFIIPPFLNGMRIFMAKLDSVATVNGITIKKKDFTRTKRSHDAYVKNLASMGLGQFAKPMNDGQILKTCALTILQEDLANRLGIEIGGQKLAEAVAKGLARHSLDKDGSLDYKRYASSVMASAGMSVVEYEKNQLSDLRTEAINELAKLSAYSPKFEFDHKNAVLSKDKKFKVIELPLKNFLSIAQKEEISPEQLELFYRENSKNYMTVQERGLSYAILNKDLFSDVTPPDDFELEEYYQRHMSDQFSIQEKYTINYLSAEFDSPEAKKELTEELEAISANAAKSGKKLSILAQKHSKLKSETKVDFSVGQSGLPYPLELELGNSKEVGSLTKVVEAGEKLYLAQIDEYTPFSIKTFEQVKDEISELIKNQKVEEAVRDQIGSMIKEARELENGQEVLDREIEKFKLKKKNLVFKQDSKPEDDLESKLYSVLFDKAAYLGYLGYLNHDQDLIIYVVNQITAPEVLALESVESEVKKDFLEKQAISTQEAAVEELRVKILLSEKIEDKLNSWDLKEETTHWVSKNDKEIKGFEFGKKIVDQLMSLEKAEQVIKHKNKDSFYLISLSEEKENKDSEKTESSENYDSSDFMTSRDWVDGFVASLLKDAKIVPNKNVLTELIPEF